jgi:cation transport regulator ChaB
LVVGKEVEYKKHTLADSSISTTSITSPTHHFDLLHPKMYNSPFVLFLTLLASLVSALPSTLYRGDARTPSVIKDGSGFKARGHDANPSQSKLFDHVEESLDHPDQDPFISTSDDSSVAKQAENGKAYLYTLDASKITEKIWDVADEYKKAGKKYVNAPEKEFAVQNAIPWGAVTKIQKKDDKGVWQDVPLPTTAVQPAAVSLTCQGTGGSKYINRDGIINVIYKFCEEAEKQNVLDKDSGSIARTYNKDTPEQVDIALDHKPGLNWYVFSPLLARRVVLLRDG